MSGWILWATCIYGWTLLGLAVVDWRHYLLPDALTLFLIPAGLAVAWAIDPAVLAEHVIGSVSGFRARSLWNFPRSGTISSPEHRPCIATAP
ncbi:MAG TPA: A24 family peptidase [Alphaproteobacteria bacterium]|nr:A24 family peptidase [Alphaproteobacteria bacterium]